VFCRWRHRPRTESLLIRTRAIATVIGAAAFGLAHWLITSAWLRATLTPDSADPSVVHELNRSGAADGGAGRRGSLRNRGPRG
jgi:hypothetical protein